MAGAGQRWRHARGELDLARVRVMAIVNLTPDSFFDGGRWMASEQLQANGSVVVSACRRWVEQGADLLDLGGESTRPGSTPVDLATEQARVLPIVERLRADPVLAEIPISVDTRHAALARSALERGAAIINDVSGLADPAMAEVVAQAGAGLVIGHLRGEPATMQQDIQFDDLLGEVGEELVVSVARALRAGVAREAILVDPCVGFGKTAEQSAALLASAALLERETGCPVLIGASRKSFLGQWARPGVDQRMLASVVAGLIAVERGARVLRVHDVGETVEALRIHAGIAAALARALAIHQGRSSA
ncbi:dihydropteroate synthase [Nannocystaceae bacterium ST9]